jgi:MFS family permease
MVARFIAGLGAWMQLVAAGFLVYQLSGSAMLVGALGAVALGPSLIGSPVAGALGDRFCLRRMSVVFAGLESLPALGLMIAAFSDALTVPLLFAGVALTAVFHSLSEPIIQLVVPYTVAPDLRHRAVANMSAVYNVAQVVGALGAGLILQVTGSWIAFAVNFAGYAAVALVIHFSPILQRACDLARASGDGHILAGTLQGLRIPLVRALLAGSVVFFVLVAPLEELMPRIAAQHGEGAAVLGLLVATICFGAVVGNPIVQRVAVDARSSQRTLAIGVVLCGIPTLLLGLSSALWSDLILLLIVGIAWELVFVSAAQSLQLDVPTEIRGRMLGLFYCLTAGMSAVGALLMGAAFTDLGVDTGLLVLGAIALACGLALWPWLARARAQLR